MATRSCVFVFVLLLLASTAVAQDYPVVSTACQGDEFILAVDVFAYFEVGSFTVRRVTTAPDLLPPVLLATIPVTTPLEMMHFEVPDPGVGPGEVGLYEIEAIWEWGGSAAVWQTLPRSCVEEPFLMRGYLTDVTEFQPCTGQGLLECETVSLLYGEMNLHIGTGELLEIYGWPTQLQARDDCSVTVVRIESLGAEQTCEDVVPAARLPWGAMKAQYR